jgi:hypothetical protein
MIAGLKAAYLWHDNDVIEIRITVENTRFRATTDVYVGTDGLCSATAIMQACPANNDDRRRIAFGGAGKAFAGGFAQLDFYCEDAAGHTCLHAVIEDDFKNRDATESAVIQVNFEPAALDTFLVELIQIERELSGSACLMTGP